MRAAVVKQMRERGLRWINRRRMIRGLRGVDLTGKMPVYVIASGPDMHCAPLAVRHGGGRIRHVIVANGVGEDGVAWLRGQVDGVPVIALRASFKQHSANYLPHAEVVRLCAEVSDGDFAIQDADCFVLRDGWWDGLVRPGAGEYACGPFRKPVHRLDAWMPDTFLVAISIEGYRRRLAEGIGPAITATVEPRVRKMLEKRGLGDGWYPDAYNRYYDTLQQQWVAAVLDGEAFRHVGGAEEEVFHVGGSTYLMAEHGVDPRHWDWWPVNTAFFHLSLLEMPRFAGVRGQGGWLFRRYGSAAGLLAEFPAFKESARYRASLFLLDHFRADCGGGAAGGGEYHPTQTSTSCGVNS